MHKLMLQCGNYTQIVYSLLPNPIKINDLAFDTFRPQSTIHNGSEIIYAKLDTKMGSKLDKVPQAPPWKSVGYHRL